MTGSFVVGTAGHIDHGKSTLVKALTGIDPDRLEEEKRRGMTIDLGFAYLDLPSGRHVGIVDVPGHHRFLKNMLAGVHGIDAVIFVVAADEGPMPQTREHLAIIDLLGIEHGVVALTKVDLVERDWLELVLEDVRRAIAPSLLAGAPIVPLSSTTGAGLDDLRAALDRALQTTTPRPDTGRPRLAVDRSFTMSGFGTVVTGTLIGGGLRVGDELTVLPAGRRARVRGLQQHNRPVEVALPGSRTAVNLVGVERRDVARGDVLAPAGQVTISRRVDARLTVLGGAPHPLRHRSQLLLYHGTAEILVEVILLDADELRPGAEGWAQIYSTQPLVTLPGDRFILRRPSPAETLAGGVIVDSMPRRHRRHDATVLQDLALRERQDPALAVTSELAKHPFGLKPVELARRLGAPPERLAEIVRRLSAERAAVEVGGLVLSAAAWERLAARVVAALKTHHAAHPLRAGMSKEELKSRTGIPPALFGETLARMVSERAVVERAGEAALPDHHPRLLPEQEAAAVAAVRELDAAPFNPPPLSEWAQGHRLPPAVLDYLVAAGRIVRVNDDTVFSRAAYDQAVSRIRAHLQANRKVTVAEARDLLHSSRRYVLPLLEWLDAQKVTRRVGDDRILRA